MDTEKEKFIYCKIENLSENDKRIISNVISEAISPLIYLKKNIDLEQLYNNYLIKIWDDSLINENLYDNYNKKIKEFFELDEYDKNSYISYNDENFFEYLSYMATVILGYVLYKNKSIFWDCSLNNFIEVSEVLDDYVYIKNKDKMKINNLIDVLQNVSQRTMQNSCEKLLRDCVEICSNSNYKNKVLILKNLSNDYIDKLNRVLHQ